MEEEMILIKRIKNHDEEAFKELLKKYHLMIYKIISHFDLSNGDYPIDEQELYQEGSLALYKACKSYEEKNEVLFSTYVYSVVFNSINSYCRAERKKSKYLLSIDSIMNQENFSGLSVGDTTQDYLREQEFSRNLDLFMESLNEKEKTLINLRKESYSYKEISEQMNVSEKYVDNHIRIIKRKLRSYLQDLEQIEKAI